LLKCKREISIDYIQNSSGLFSLDEMLQSKLEKHNAVQAMTISYVFAKKCQKLLEANIGSQIGIVTTLLYCMRVRQSTI
jgi:hypothetical protein